MKLAVLGGGNMGEAFVAGMLAAGVAEEIWLAELLEERRLDLASRFDVHATGDAAEAVRGADAVLIAVKPQDLKSCLAEAGPAIGKEALVVSIAAGVSIARLAELFPNGLSLVRAMPNLAATVGAGVTAYVCPEGTSEAHRELAAHILTSVGPVVEVPETALDAVTAVSGSGPAYVFALAESMCGAGIEAGLDADTAAMLTANTLLGAARLLTEMGPGAPGGHSPAEWREAVTSKGGTTEAALAIFESEGFDAIIKQAVDAARRRSAELGSAS